MTSPIEDAQTQLLGSNAERRNGSMSFLPNRASEMQIRSKGETPHVANEFRDAVIRKEYSVEADS